MGPRAAKQNGGLSRLGSWRNEKARRASSGLTRAGRPDRLPGGGTWFVCPKPMTGPSIFMRKVVLQNYMSIARCTVAMRPLLFLVGPNGAGKSNFLDALRFVSDGLNTTVEHALRDRGGIGEVRRRSAGHPTHFRIALDWGLPSGESGTYEFRVGAKPKGAFEVQEESCVVQSTNVLTPPVGFSVRSGRVERCDVGSAPAAAADRLFLVAMSGHPVFRPLYDALVRMCFYNFNPDVVRELQAPDPGEVLAADGSNLASVVKRLSEAGWKSRHDRVVELLGRVVPGLIGVDHKTLGKKETLQFRQQMARSKEAWRFDAENMSDGTLRTLGVLVALFQPASSDGRTVRVVGIEEPETALHPGAAAVLRSALIEASRHTQVLVTSHSPDLLDDKQIPPEALLVVANREGETFLGPMDAASRSAVQDRLYTPGELLRLNQIETDATGAAVDATSEPSLL